MGMHAWSVRLKLVSCRRLPVRSLPLRNSIISRLLTALILIAGFPSLARGDDLHLRLAGIAGSGSDDAVAILEDTVSGAQIALSRGEKAPSDFPIPLQLIEIGPESALVQLDFDAAVEISLKGTIEALFAGSRQSISQQEEPVRYWDEMNRKAPKPGSEWLN